ncbi:MAG: UDP-glucuronic acid decarboxylase family protein [Alphaproteobacteria bacterium]
MKTILITGGAGFIGSHLSRKLLSAGNRVIILDDFSTGSRGNIEDLLQNQNCSLIEHDITQPLTIHHSLSTVHQIYNLACPASPPAYQEDPIKTTLTNVIGMRNVLELAKQTGARVLQASTSEIYGDPQVHPQPENYLGNVNTIGPRACYDEGKRCAETLCFDYHRQHKVDIKVARIFNTYGPAMAKDDGRVVTNFIYQALENRAITMYGDGSQTRSFCYVDDMVSGLIALMESAAGITGPINLGNPDEFTMEELAELVLEITGSSSPLEYKPLPQDDPLQRQPDITLAKKFLNWQPTIKLRTGLEKTIAHAKKHIHQAA